MIKLLSLNLIVIVSLLVSSGISAKAEKDNAPAALAASSQEVYQLSYIEREPGVDEYEVTLLVSDRYIRIEEENEDSGYILYDDKEKTIYSVSHHDDSVLVIKQRRFSENDSPAKPQVEYLQLADAPPVSGKNVFNYRVYTGEGAAEETCLEVQLVEGLLPEVCKIMKNYQNVVSGQQVRMSSNKITSVQTPCYFIDQIYNEAKYYDKGLPIQEWHSNESSKILSTYKKVTVNKDKFSVPEKYRRFSIDKDSKISID